MLEILCTRVTCLFEASIITKQITVMRHVHCQSLCLNLKIIWHEYCAKGFAHTACELVTQIFQMRVYPNKCIGNEYGT